MNKSGGISDIERVKRQTILEIGQLIRAYMERTGATQNDLAQRTGISKRTIAALTAYAGGDNPPNPTLATLKMLYKEIGVEDWIAPRWDD